MPRATTDLDLTLAVNGDARRFKVAPAERAIVRVLRDLTEANP